MGKDFVEICPKCKSKDIAIRQRKTPKYYCTACKNEFDDPKTMLPNTTRKQQKEIGKQYSNPDE
jgi:transposase-like protein